MREEFVARLLDLAKTDSRLMLITADLGFGVLNKFRSEVPKQFLNVGVAEQNMTGVAVGLALEGHIPFTYSISNFPILRCLEQIRNDAAYHEANVKIVSTGAGFSYGALGMSHHATEDMSIMRALPGITVISPSCLWEAEEATNVMIDTPGVCFFRLDKSHAGRTNRPGEVFQLGRPRTLREGSDITLITTGGLLVEVLEAAEILSQEHRIEARVMNVHTLKPFGAEEICAASKETGGIVTVEEHVLDGGLGSAVAEVLMDGGTPPAAFYRLGLKGGYSAIVGSQAYLRSRHGLDRVGIVNSVLKTIGTATQNRAETASISG